MMAKTRLLFLSLLLLFGCNNYGMLDKLENPGGGGNLAGSPSSPPPGPPPTYRIFVTFGSYDGNRGGIAGADLNCQTDSNKPGGTATWKAMLVAGTTRRACTSANCSTNGNSEHNDWVLKPNATYVRPDGTLIGSTDANALLIFPLSNSIGTTDVQPWTGLNIDWTTDNLNNCNNWGITAFNVYGRIGQANLLLSDTIDVSNIRACDSPRPLYCVEQ
jgi:hypothetical protein